MRFPLRFGLVVVALCATLSSALAASKDPEIFVQDLIGTAVSQLGGEEPESVRARRFRGLIDEHLALPTIVRFVCGKHWPRASEEQREDFKVAFRRLLVSRFLPAFDSVEELDYEVKGAERLKPGLWSVVVGLRPGPDADPVSVKLRILDRQGDMRVADVVIRGVSLGLTLREEYTTYLDRHGGKLSALTRDLRNRAEGLRR